jgi:aryl-alcohol dehydrogenase-like predicted oxidoreductase
VLKARGGTRPFVATKAGRAEGNQPTHYRRESLERYVDRSLTNLQTEALDLLQLHCPHPAIYYMPEVFDALDGLVVAGKLKRYGVSVEKVEEGLKALEYPNVKTVQIIFNIFRQRPAGLFFEQAKAKQVGILARVPLASGLLTGKMSAQTNFAQEDHRSFNRHGEAFDRGETFSGVDYETGLEAVAAIRPLVPEGATMAQFALRWILMHEAVSCAIPGAKRPSQAEDNIAAAELPALSDSAMTRLREIYDQYIRADVHQRW